MILEELFKKYGTDKYNHNYAPFYTELFEHRRLEVLHILEIGALEGAGTMAFLEYFPNATITCIDSLLDKKAKVLNHPRITYIVGDALKTDTYENITDQFDLIVEDAIKNINTLKEDFILKKLFSLLKNNGVLVLEDQRPMKLASDFLVKDPNLSRTIELLKFIEYALIFGHSVICHDNNGRLESKYNGNSTIVGIQKH